MREPFWPHTRERYWPRFESHVYRLLGGLDMAEEFFNRHPGARISMLRSRRYHFEKGGAAHKGATIFYERTLKPIIARDRDRAKKRPIPRRRPPQQ